MSFCRSVHNSRIERLWFDFTQALGAKWHSFFMNLEHNYGLNQDNPGHIWLLHHLFLHLINNEAQEWAEAWNAHTMEIRGGPDCSPRDMFLFGMLQDGPRGLEHATSHTADDHLNEEEMALYGIDWEAQQDPILMNQVLENEPQDWEDDNPFQTVSSPDHMAEVICDPPGCPLIADQVLSLDLQLSTRIDLTSRDMEVRKLIWVEALDICRNFFNGNN